MSGGRQARAVIPAQAGIERLAPAPTVVLRLFHTLSLS
jgi:hypothetical protein